MKSIKHILILLLVFITGTTLLACGKNSNEDKEHYCTYSDWVTVKEADCINDGLKERSCYECGRKMSEVIEAYGHLFSASAGSFAEDGTLQGLLQMSGIPFVGCNCITSALGMDKAYTTGVGKVTATSFISTDTSTVRATPTAKPAPPFCTLMKAVCPTPSPRV